VRRGDRRGCRIRFGAANGDEFKLYEVVQWARGYWVATSGIVTDDVWKEYIANQKSPEPDDDFHVM